MSEHQSRYSGVRDAYFSAGNTPPIPPRQETILSNDSGSRRSSSPSSPRHPRRPHPFNSHAHYTEYSHSVPRSRSKPNLVQDGVLRDTAAARALEHAVVRSSSFINPSPSETPPTLPPRPSPVIPKTFKRKQPKFLTGDLSFEDLIHHHQKSFPLRIYITNGYLGATSRLTISTGDMYNIHFLKRTRVMLFRDHHDTPYSIPLNSAIEFGLIFEPKEGRKPTELEAGIIFSSVADLLSQPETPKVVSVMKSWRSTEVKSAPVTSLVTNEVLVIKSAQRSLFSKKGLRVFSLTTKSDKFLSEDCTTQFSTQPALCHLHITDIVEHVKQAKRQRCILFLNSQVLVNRELSTSMQTIPDDLFDKVLTIIDQVTETSLIASSVLHRRLEVTLEDFDPDRDTLFDIPVDENTALMTCSVVEITDSTDSDRLYDDTKTLYEKFDPTKVMSVKDTGSEDTQEAQKLLYHTVRIGCEALGVELDRPEALYDIIPSEKRLMEPLPASSSSSSASPLTTAANTAAASPRLPSKSLRSPDHTDTLEYEDISPESLHHRQLPTPIVSHGNSKQPVDGEAQGRLEKKVEEMECQLRQSQTQMSRFHSRLEQGLSRVGDLEEGVARMKTTVEKLLPQIYALQSRLTLITTSPQKQSSTTAAAGTSATADDGDRQKQTGGQERVTEENKKYLLNLSTQEVGTLLDAMELGQYKDAFSKENVSGEILLECDNDILQCELGVASRLHRLRLMKVVEGRHSAAALIEGADPYVTLGTT